MSMALIMGYSSQILSAANARGVNLVLLSYNEMVQINKFLLIFIFFSQMSQAADASLSAYSQTINKELPEKFDSITVLRTSTVENNHLYFHFVLNATPEEFNGAFSKVKTQILKTICGQSREKQVLKGFKANLVYRYENQKGQSLGEFMVQPSHCH